MRGLFTTTPGTARRLLAEASLRSAAEGLGREIAAMPSPDEVVGNIARRLGGEPDDGAGPA